MEARPGFDPDTFASLFAESPEAVTFYDLQGILKEANAANLDLTGYTPEQMHGVSFRQLIPRIDIVRGEMAFSMACDGLSDHFETTLKHADGRIIPVEVVVVPARVGNEIRGIFVLARDIAALRDAEEAMRVNQQRFRSLFEYHPDGIVELKADGIISRVNVAFESETGLLGEKVVGKTWSELILADRRQQAEEARLEAMRGEAAEHESTLLDRLGYHIEVQLKLVPLHSGEAITGCYAIFKNVSAQRTAERAVVAQVDRLRRLTLVTASLDLTLAQRIEAILDLGLEFFGFEEGYVVRFDDDNIFVQSSVGRGAPLPTGTRVPLARTLLRHLSAERPFLFVPNLDSEEWRSDPASAGSHWRSYVATQLRVNEKPYGGLVFAGRRERFEGLDELARESITLMGLLVAAALERERNAERIEQLAFTDSLTALPNRVLFADRIEQAQGAAKRYGRGFAVMYLDLDNFKAINDTYGHMIGDEVLVAVAHRLRELLRESDTIARFGGDEFVILQPVVEGAADAADLARKIGEALATPIVIEGVEHRVATSIGIALWPEHATDTERLMELADAALYRAKREGRNRSHFAVRPEVTTPRAPDSGAARSDDVA
ncbi:MAG TPA: diguanylate cyclase [Candidatus Dormibacteraeota bacterium]|nr:diguanylate cyclase [Candidatus Dormibacteraeota bacterium]